VHPGIGAAGPDDIGHVVAQVLRERLLELARDRALVGLRGEAPKPRAVVRDGQGEVRPPRGRRVRRGAGVDARFRRVEEGHTSSTLAIGALSPGRGPSLRMRR